MRHSSIAILIAALVLSPQAWGQTPATAPTASAPSKLDAAAWRADLHALADALATRHKDAFTQVSREQFSAAVNDLDARIGNLSDAQVVLEFKRLVAMVGDAHTQLGDAKGRFNRPYFPFSVLLLGDGVYITATTPAQTSLLGKKIARVGSTPIDEVIAKLGAIIPHENDAWLRVQARMLLMSPDALQFVGVIDDPQQASFTLADEAGVENVVTLALMQPGERQSPDPRLAQNNLAPTLRQRPTGAIYASMMLPDSRDLYVWYDSCSDMQGKTVAKFAAETLDRIERDKPERIFIDLRRNSGGNSALILPLIKGLAGRDDLKQRGRLFVLIGPGTFSSGLWAAQDLRKSTSAILVGSPTGGKPNSFGEQRSVQLPNSGLTLFYSTKKWMRDPDGDPDSLEPDLLIEATYADLIGGKDAVLDAARAHKSK